MFKLYLHARDPLSFQTHFIGAIASFVGLCLLVITGVRTNVSNYMIGALVLFGLSMLALYSASSVYHYFHGESKIQTVLRKLDHSMIYVLIVGTYTPIVMYCMDAPRSYYFLAFMWGVALLGIILKVLWINAPRFISTILYLILGWAVLFDFSAFSIIPGSILGIIALGGVSYTVGAVIYILKKPSLSVRFGFHELFHVFVMIGSLLHYIAIFMLVF